MERHPLVRELESRGYQVFIVEEEALCHELHIVVTSGHDPVETLLSGVSSFPIPYTLKKNKDAKYKSKTLEKYLGQNSLDVAILRILQDIVAYEGYLEKADKSTEKNSGKSGKRGRPSKSKCDGKQKQEKREKREKPKSLEEINDELAKEFGSVATED